MFVTDVRRESILPAYRSAVDEAVVLRAAVAELTYHINRFNLALADATPEIAVPLVVAVADRLARFLAGIVVGGSVHARTPEGRRCLPALFQVARTALGQPARP